MFVFARISLGTPMREATRECPVPKGKRRFSGRGRKKFRPSLAIAARSVRGRFVVEGTGKAEPRSSRRAQAKHRAGDREKAGKNWRDGPTQNFPQKGDGIEDASRKHRTRQRRLIAPSCDEAFWRKLAGVATASSASADRLTSD